jgi:hypothetical protein
MKKLLIISNCKQCYNCYTNYLPDGKSGKLWCSQLNVELVKDKYIPKECTLIDVDILEPNEPDFNPSDNDPIDDNA